MKITIRDWFWLTLVIAISVGWWLDHRANQRDRVEIPSVVTNTASHLVEIGVGLDDGVQQGMVMDVYRGKNFLGRIRIERLNNDRAVGVQLGFKRVGIRKGDTVIGYFTRPKDWVSL